MGTPSKPIPSITPPRYALPKASKGQRIGLLGGSFDPPHAGHLHISRAALKRFGLDEVWWLVSPGNPLKKNAPAALDARLEAANKLVDHPRIKVTDIEAQIGTRYTAETLKEMFRLYRHVEFVWLMGADNMAEFHHWDRWNWIMQNVPIGVIARPGARTTARMSVAAQSYRTARLRGAERMQLAKTHPPAWCFINVPMVDISSTEIRKTGAWTR